MRQCIVIAMRKPSKNLSPLGRWRIARGLTEAAIVELLEERTGVVLDQSTLSRYCNGDLWPSVPMRMVFSRLTRGKVPESAWEK
jgi:transcriptional regulator with XRE-family HTH domain